MRLRGGVYLYRTRKPAALFNLPLLSRHWAYVGQTSSFWHRHRQHGETQPWSNLDPKCYRIPLPDWRWLRLVIEQAMICLVWPVYNHSGNLWNPRRIPLSMAKRQRYARDHGGIRFNFRPVHLVLILALAVLVWTKIGGAW